LTELDTDEVLISDYEVDAIVAKVVTEIKDYVFAAAVVIMLFIFICAMGIVYEMRLLLG